jgi:2-keto-4-pentenoate hydratase/2-oxohepta-3-ene-1,7-dioic acid hydratase in catechol pathway
VKFGRIERRGLSGATARLVAVDTEHRCVVDLQRAEHLRRIRCGSDGAAAARFAAAMFPGSMAAALGSPTFAADAATAVAFAEEESVVPFDEVHWLAPVDAPRYRDFMSFEQHHLTAAVRSGLGRPPEVIYRLPVYYKGGHATLIGHEQEVSWPSYSDFLDFELELGFVVGAVPQVGGCDLTPEEAKGLLFGVTVLNDFSARDRQFEELAGRLGPAKGKDFATAIGPWVTTVDELDLLGMRMTARINTETWADGTSGSAMWHAQELLAYLSTCEPLLTGELVGSGTLGGGCGIEVQRRLIPGDLVELEVSGIGVLRNRLGAKPDAPRWAPQPRTPGICIDGGTVTGPTQPLPPRPDAPAVPGRA